MDNKPVKPKLRGYLHKEGFFIALGACIMLLVRASDSPTHLFIGLIVYSLGLLSLFGVSACYHRIHWEPKPRAIMKRLDHSAIFIMIAGTATPIILVALPDGISQKFMMLIWGVGIAGVLQAVFWVKAPKALAAVFYVVMGWLVVPYLPELKAGLGETQLNLLIAGGVVYTIGAIFYARKKPNLIPGVFGSHELFHLFTLIGAAFHFAVIYKLVL